MKKLIPAIAAIILAIATPAYATGNHGQNKITLCHATSSQSNPYVEITVAVPSVQFNGHDGHSDDIIPPFTGYAGKNWDAQYIAIYNNGCKKPVPTTTTTTTEPPCPPTTTTTIPATTTTTVPPTTTTVPPTTTTIPPTTTTTIVIPPETTTTTTLPTTTSTVPPSTTTTTVVSSTSTTVAPTTTTSPPSTTSSSVLSPTTTVLSPTTSVTITQSPELAKTGTDTQPWIFLGAMLILIGSAFLGLAKGRRNA